MLFFGRRFEERRAAAMASSRGEEATKHGVTVELKIGKEEVRPRMLLSQPYAAFWSQLTRKRDGDGRRLISEEAAVSYSQ
jgi:hypothetical protein